jgi:hypothetical protein
MTPPHQLFIFKMAKLSLANRHTSHAHTQALMSKRLPVTRAKSALQQQKQL